MNLKNYTKDHWFFLFLSSFCLFFLYAMLRAFKADEELIFGILFTLLLFFALFFFYEFFRKRNFYQQFLKQLDSLDQKYLITELIETPSFLEGKLLLSSLYEIDKSMNEAIMTLKNANQDFKDYVEMWIHEVKIPLANVLLMNHNGEKDLRLTKQIHMMENYVEQILYYVRSEISEKDYLITSCLLSEIIHKVILRNKESFLEKDMKVINEVQNVSVLTDSKWLEFILNQIVNNSIKYSQKKNGFLKFSVVQEKDRTILSITDHGIGIKDQDKNRIFEKSFTGENGRKVGSSTGMGLFICQNLCQKLGHHLFLASSKKGETIFSIEFFQNDYYDVLKEDNLTKK